MNRPSRPRVLIVDDQAANIDVLAEALGEAYELFAATTAERALEIAAGGVDLILLDVVMPGRDGFELCRMLKAREKTRGIPVIFVTALGDVEDEARGFEVGGVDYIAKPISPPTVRARVRTHLDLRGAQRRLEKEAEVLAENLRLKEHVERLSRHDLKTPLTSIISIPQILLETPGLSHDHARLLRAVEAAGYRILDMVNRFLDLFRMESGTYEFRPARVDIGELVDRVALDLSAIAKERQVELDLSARPETPVSALAEELLSYSMLANLIKNAVEAAPPRTMVRVSVEESEGEIRIAVQNQGAVPEALRETFFHKYSSSGKKSGTGLGTYSARLMAETQRGRIEMSTSDQTGTTVTVRLAEAKAPFATSGSETPTTEIRRRFLPTARILVVDDDEATRLVLSTFLKGAKSVVLAEDGLRALLEAETFDPHIVFLDAEMPRLDGFATAARLRALEGAAGSARRFLVGLSSHDDAESQQAFLRAGCDLVLVKPVPRAAVLAAVETGLAPPASPSDPNLMIDAADEPVLVDPDLVPMIPAFLESRREQARDLAQALVAGEVERARGLAHKLRGGLEMCGFSRAGALSRSIEEALSGGQSPDAVAVQSRALRAYLDKVQYRPRNDQ